MLKNCFMDDQPDFYFNAEVDGVNYGTMRHLTTDDFDFIARYADRKVEYDKNGKPVTQKITVKDEQGKEVEEEIVQYDYNFSKLTDAYLLCAFGGTDPSGYERKLGQEGWLMDRPCNVENIALLKQEIKAGLYKLIVQKQRDFTDNKENIEKN